MTMHVHVSTGKVSYKILSILTSPVDFFFFFFAPAIWSGGWAPQLSPCNLFAGELTRYLGQRAVSHSLGLSQIPKHISFSPREIHRAARDHA